eukprot:gene12114-16219_t
MEEVFSKEVRPLLDLIDNLRESGLQNELSLPQICVMGDQSSGKSSVLQAICGIPFPRGSGLVTRCPTELIMTKSKPGSPWKGEISVSWKQDQPTGTGSVNSVDELTERISSLADILTDNKINGFSTDCIVIKISSPDSPDLTLIDLPGIVRTITSGQDTSVIAQVNNLIQTYISMPNTIILAVIPCNQDIATVDILERASISDPQGLRTIGVLTKPDLIGPGNEEEVVKVLLNITKPLKLGYVMVKNISQKQANEGMTIQMAKSDEIKFFDNHPVFSTVVEKNKFGVLNLVTSLTNLLVQCIKRSLPTMIQDIKRISEEYKAELSELGFDLPKESRDQHALLVRKISSYCELLNLSSKGEYRDSQGLLSSHQDYRLHMKVQQSFRKLQEGIINLRPVTHSVNAPNRFDNLEDEMIAQKGRELPGFINSQVFYSQIVDLVEEWRTIVEDCRSEVIQKTHEISSLISERIIQEFPELRNAIQKITTGLIESVADDITEKIEVLLTREQNPFTTQDVLLEVVNGIRFRTFENALRQILDTTDIKTLGDNSAVLREDVRRRLGAWYIHRHGVNSKGNEQEMITLIQAYWDIASRRFIDNVCMCLDLEFTNK